MLLFFTFSSLLCVQTTEEKQILKSSSFKHLIVNIYTETSPSVYSVTFLKLIGSSHPQGYTKMQVEQDRVGRKCIWLHTQWLMGSKLKQGQIPTLRVTRSCLELIFSGSYGSLLDHPNQGKFLTSTYLQSEVNCNISSLRPEQELQKGLDELSFSYWCSSSHSKEVST